MTRTLRALSFSFWNSLEAPPPPHVRVVLPPAPESPACGRLGPSCTAISVRCKSQTDVCQTLNKQITVSALNSDSSGSLFSLFFPLKRVSNYSAGRVQMGSHPRPRERNASPVGERQWGRGTPSSQQTRREPDRNASAPGTGHTALRGAGPLEAPWWRSLPEGSPQRTCPPGSCRHT